MNSCFVCQSLTAWFLKVRSPQLICVHAEKISLCFSFLGSVRSPDICWSLSCFPCAFFAANFPAHSKSITLQHLLSSVTFLTRTSCSPCGQKNCSERWKGSVLVCYWSILPLPSVCECVQCRSYRVTSAYFQRLLLILVMLRCAYGYDGCGGQSPH